MNWVLRVIIFPLTLIIAGCRHDSEGREGGLAISFDDRFIAEWYSLRPLFQEFNARVTFYINGDTLSREQIEMLHQLKDDGHEIAFHGTIHGDAEQLLDEHGPGGYFDIEIAPGLAFLRRHGFHPTSYAHPGGTSTQRTDSVLLANGFVTLREVSKAERYYKGVRLFHLRPSWMPHIFYDFDGRYSMYALEIDRQTTLSVDEMRQALVKAKSKGEVLMLFGHQPLDDESPSGLYGFDTSFLRSILAETHKQGLRFYTMSELR